MTTDTDLSVIAHLDFDPDSDKEEVCLGWKIKKGRVEIFNKTCSNPVKIRAVRGCCGKISTFCLECYNDVVSNDIFMHGEAPNLHLATYPKFSQVHFL